MPKRPTNKKIIWPLIFFCLILGCSNWNKEYISSDYGLNVSQGLPEGKSVVVLTPLLSFKQADSNDVSDHYTNLTKESSIKGIVEKMLTNKGLSVVSVTSLGKSKRTRINPLLNHLVKNRPILASRFQDKNDFIATLNDLQDLSGAVYLCVVLLDVDLGHFWGMDPILITKNVWETTHSSDLKIAMLSLQHGKHVWRNEVYVRALPTDEMVTQWVETLFTP